MCWAWGWWLWGIWDENLQFVVILNVWTTFSTFQTYNISIGQPKSWKILRATSLLSRANQPKSKSGRRCSWGGRSERKRPAACAWSMKKKNTLLRRAQSTSNQTAGRWESNTSTSPSFNNDLYFFLFSSIHYPIFPQLPYSLTKW